MSEKTLEYRGTRLTVFYTVARCIHAAECVKGLPGVFDPQRKPWILPDQADADAVVEVIERCPTGALGYRREDGGAAEPAAPESTARVTADGPVYLRGDLQLQGAAGAGGTLRRLALCRCGASANKPFCDGSHERAGFADAGRLGSPSSKAEPAPGQSGLELRCVENGPVLVKGPLSVVSADGAQRLGVKETAFCRCGASANKPFCDGSHKRVGFRSD